MLGNDCTNLLLRQVASNRNPMDLAPWTLDYLRQQLS